MNTPYDAQEDYHYFVELRTQHKWDQGIEEPMVLIHKIVHHSGDDKPSRVLRRDPSHEHPDAQGMSSHPKRRPPMSYVFDDEARIGITTRSIQQSNQQEGGRATIYVGTGPRNVRLHELDRSRIGGEIGRHKWAEGWTSVEFYEADG